MSPPSPSSPVGISFDVGGVSAVSSDRRTVVMSIKSCSDRPGAKGAVVDAVEVVSRGACLEAQTIQSIACSRSHWFASGLTFGRLSKKYMCGPLSIAGLCFSTKSNSVWQVMYLGASQWNPFAFFHLHVGVGKCISTLAKLVQSCTSRRFAYAPSRNIF